MVSCLTSPEAKVDFIFILVNIQYFSPLVLIPLNVNGIWDIPFRERPFDFYGGGGRKIF